MKSYSFTTQNSIGKQGEEMLDLWLKSKYRITDVSEAPYFQERCIDRILEKADGSTIFVEYKFDQAARKTGNIFFETISIDSKGVPGWGWKTQADYLLTLVPDQEVIVVRPATLRALMWQERHSVQDKYIPNVGYQTVGCPIHLNKVRDASFYWARINGSMNSLEIPSF